MYIIRFNRYLAEHLARECLQTAEYICDISEQLKTCADSIEYMSGFGIQNITGEIRREAKMAECVAGDMLELKGKTEHIIGIYEEAESRVHMLIDKLPALTHGSISESTSAVMTETVGITADINVTESMLLCDNTVMHEDWLTVLIAKNKFGG